MRLLGRERRDYRALISKSPKPACRPKASAKRQLNGRSGLFFRNRCAGDGRFFKEAELLGELAVRRRGEQKYG